MEEKIVCKVCGVDLNIKNEGIVHTHVGCVQNDPTLEKQFLNIIEQNCIDLEVLANRIEDDNLETDELFDVFYEYKEVITEHIRLMIKQNLKLVNDKRKGSD